MLYLAGTFGAIFMFWLKLANFESAFCQERVAVFLCLTYERVCVCVMDLKDLGKHNNKACFYGVYVQ